MLIRVRCAPCDRTEDLFVDSKPDRLPDCPVCGGERRRDRVEASLSVREKFDNGVMPRAVEKFSEIQRLVTNREPKNPIW